jgi:hypothetical protein
MGLKRYIYKSGLDVIAPLKCGTRWLEYLDVENRIDTFGLHITDLKEHIHSGTTFIWRGVREHFVSAVQTEWSMAPDRSIWDIITQMESGECGHWNPNLYRELYPLWEKTPFRFHKLRALSELTPTANELGYTTSQYAFPKPIEWDTVEAALSSLSPKHTIRINRFIDDEETRLKWMLKPQYSKKSWEDYSDLEDSLLEMKIRVKDMEAEVSRVTDSKWAEGLKSMIRELRESNTNLQAKLDYSESVFGKVPIKLI